MVVSFSLQYLIVFTYVIFSYIESLEFSAITSKILWSQLSTEAKSRYSFDLNRLIKLIFMS